MKNLLNWTVYLTFTLLFVVGVAAYAGAGPMQGVCESGCPNEQLAAGKTGDGGNSSVGEEAGPKAEKVPGEAHGPCGDRVKEEDMSPECWDLILHLGARQEFDPFAGAGIGAPGTDGNSVRGFGQGRICRFVQVVDMWGNVIFVWRCFDYFY